MRFKINAILCVPMFLLLSDSTMPRPIVIAHRGASADFPENTLRSITEAWRQNADAVEIDVHPSADRRAMVIHDATTKRTTGIDLVVSATQSSVLRQLDAGSWKAKSFANERIPYLDEVLTTLPKRKKLLIELKGDLSTVQPVVDAIRARGTTEGLCIISFSLPMLCEIKRHLSGVPTLWLRSTLTTPETKTPLPHPISWLDIATSNSFSGVDVHYGGLTREFVEEARKRGLSVYVWTVNDQAEVERVARSGVDGITTDKPGETLSILRGLE